MLFSQLCSRLYFGFFEILIYLFTTKQRCLSTISHSLYIYISWYIGSIEAIVDSSRNADKRRSARHLQVLQHSLGHPVNYQIYIYVGMLRRIHDHIIVDISRNSFFAICLIVVAVHSYFCMLLFLNYAH